MSEKYLLANDEIEIPLISATSGITVIRHENLYVADRVLFEGISYAPLREDTFFDGISDLSKKNDAEVKISIFKDIENLGDIYNWNKKNYILGSTGLGRFQELAEFLGFLLKESQSLVGWKISDVDRLILEFFNRRVNDPLETYHTVMSNLVDTTVLFELDGVFVSVVIFDNRIVVTTNSDPGKQSDFKVVHVNGHHGNFLDEIGVMSFIKNFPKFVVPEVLELLSGHLGEEKVNEAMFATKMTL